MYLLIVIAIAIIALAILAKTDILAKLMSKSNTPASKDETLPYKKEKSLLTPTEKAFYEVLHKAIENDQVIMVKVRLLDLLTITKGTENYQRYKNKVQSKHIDFVICSRREIRPLVAVELNDKSHDTPTQKKRDTFVKKTMAAAELPFLQIPAKRTYNTHELAEQIKAATRPAEQAELKP